MQGGFLLLLFFARQRKVRINSLIFINIAGKFTYNLKCESLSQTKSLVGRRRGGGRFAINTMTGGLVACQSFLFNFYDLTDQEINIVASDPLIAGTARSYKCRK